MAFFQGLTDSRNQVSRDMRLGDVGGSTGGKRGGHEILVRMNRQKNDLDTGIGGLQLGYCLQSIENRHRDINHQHIGIETPRFQYGIPSIPYGTNDVKFLAQHHAYPCQDSFMIVREQHSNLSHTPHVAPSAADQRAFLPKQAHAAYCHNGQ